MKNKNGILLFLAIVVGVISLKCSTVKATEIETNFKQGRNVEYKDNKDLDDRELNIRFDDFEKNLDIYRGYLENDVKQETKIVEGLKIIETNLNWNGELDLNNNPKTLVLHHIEASRPGQTIPVTDVHQWHLANGWIGIGYHFYVTKTGRIYRGRPENAIGAHAKNFNKDSLSIAVEGKYGVENMPIIQRNIVEKLGGHLRSKYNIQKIKGHGELMATSCPGGKYPLNGIRNNIAKYPVYLEPEAPNVGSGLAVQYESHIQNEGWQNWVKNGEVSGSIGLSRRVEGIKIKLANMPNSNIVYRTHVEGYGWLPWVGNGEMSGTKMEAKRIEAIQIKLEGQVLDNYEIEYRTHIQDMGWLPWVGNGDVSGTEGLSRRVEAIEIRLVEKFKKIKYKTHVQDYGWGDWKNDGQLSGTIGSEKRIESIIIKVDDNQLSNLNIRYRAHVQEYGWMPWVKEGEIVGTTNESKRIEAIQVEVDGANPKGYEVEYRTHVQNIGWMPWVKNGQLSGTEGESKRIEAIEIRVK